MKKTNKEIQQDELQTLMNKGIEIIIGGKKCTIKEPTLAVLDRMSEIWLKFPDISDEITTAEAMSVARREIRNHAKNMAEVVAIAILGERIFVPIIGSWLLKRMKRHIYHNCQPSNLKSLVEIITATNGLVNFVVSMKLMSIAVTTSKKNDIE